MTGTSAMFGSQVHCRTLPWQPETTLSRAGEWIQVIEIIWFLQTFIEAGQVARNLITRHAGRALRGRPDPPGRRHRTGTCIRDMEN